jgi:protocadherin Fat 1/2/3
MTSHARLVVHLLDINDNKPEFELSTYEETLSESVSVGQSVARVYATSRDAGVNAEIAYSLMAGNELGKFRIDAKTGTEGVYY